MNPTSKKSPDTVTDAGWLNWLPGIAGLLAAILIGSYLFTFHKLPTNENPAAWGTFGDYMGGLLNPLISLFTLIVAMKVWGLQKTELLETRKAVEEQGKTAEQQRREQRFFDLLNLYQITLQSISFEEPTKAGPLTRSGKQAFHFLATSASSPLEELHSWIQSKKNTDSTKGSLPNLGSCIEIWGRQSPLLEHYFRTIFMILREAEPTFKEDHVRFIELFRAQLSRDEVNFLALYLFFGEEHEENRSLIDSYDLLKHMPISYLSESDKQRRPTRNKCAVAHPATQREEPHAD